MTTLAVLSVLNAMWQGAVLAILVALAIRAVPRRNAATTCALWSIVYLVIAFLPLVDFALARPVAASLAGADATALRTVVSSSASLARARHAVVPSPQSRASALRPSPLAAAESASALVSHRIPRVSRADVPDRPRLMPFAGANAPLGLEALRRVAALPADAGLFAVAHSLSDAIGTCAWPMLAGWAVVDTILLWRLAWSYALVLRVKRAATPLTMSLPAVNLHRGRAAGLRTSADVRVPCAIGFAKPVIVVPRALAETLEPHDLARIVLHEHAHLRRYDDWINALQRIAGAVLFFNPVLHYVARRIDLDREVACDDAVVADMGDPLEYAKCLTKIVDRRTRGPFALVPGFFFRRSQVIARVDRLIGLRSSMSTRVARWAPAAAAVLTVSAVLLARVQVPVFAASLDPAPAVSAAPAEHAATASSAPSSAARASSAAAARPTPHVGAHVSPRASAARASARSASDSSVDVQRVIDAASAAAERAYRDTSAMQQRVERETLQAAKQRWLVDAHRTDVRGLTAGQREALAKAARDMDDATRMRAVRPLDDAQLRQLRAQLDALDAKRLARVKALAGANLRALDAARVSQAKAFSEAQRAADETQRAALKHAVAQLQRNAETFQHLARVQALQAADMPNVKALTDAQIRRLHELDLQPLRAGPADRLGIVAALQPLVRGDVLDTLVKEGYPRPQVGELIDMEQDGVTADLVSAMAPSHPSAEQLIRLARHGVSGRYVRAMAAAGYPNLTSGQLVGLVDAGVTPQFVKRLEAHGYSHPSVEELVKLAQAGR
ncbi:MAG TPA: M56 family metallopeptidase [Candidatus Baltobacteraceae bacterium]|nr:M56 family metallopeptidase [Candidatus Baltobacteraceae bacterium]